MAIDVYKPGAKKDETPDFLSTLGTIIGGVAGTVLAPGVGTMAGASIGGGVGKTAGSLVKKGGPDLGGAAQGAGSALGTKMDDGGTLGGYGMDAIKRRFGASKVT